MFSIEGIVRLLGLKTLESRCLSVSALSFIARLPSDFLDDKEIVLIFKILPLVFHNEPSLSERRLVCLEKFSECDFAICLLRSEHKLL